MATRAPKPKILFVKRADKFVIITHESKRASEQVVDVEKSKASKAEDKPATGLRESHEHIDLKAFEAPLPAFDESLRALGPVVAKAMGCDPAWGQEGIEIVGFSLSYTESGIRTVEINFAKSLLGGSKLHPLKTPAFQIDDGKTTEDGKRQCTPKHAELVVDAIKEAQRYVLGERSQELLNFKETAEEGNDDKIEQLPGMGKPNASEAGD